MIVSLCFVGIFCCVLLCIFSVFVFFCRVFFGGLVCLVWDGLFWVWFRFVVYVWFGAFVGGFFWFVLVVCCSGVFVLLVLVVCCFSVLVVVGFFVCCFWGFFFLYCLVVGCYWCLCLCFFVRVVVGVFFLVLRGVSIVCCGVFDVFMLFWVQVLVVVIVCGVVLRFVVLGVCVFFCFVWGFGVCYLGFCLSLVFWLVFFGCRGWLLGGGGLGVCGC